jgi:hypothetical protein
VAFLAALVAFGSRFASKILTTSLGWASTLLFGRVPASRQILLLGITFGSVIWIVLLIGLIVPDVGAFLLLLIPPQDYVADDVIRLAMLIGVLVVPAAVGAATLALTQVEPRTVRSVGTAVVRGYPLTVLLAFLLLFLTGLAIWRKGVSFARRWTDAHVPMVVDPGAYDRVAADLDTALTAAGLDVRPEVAPAAMSLPARWLAAVAGGGSAGLVPDRMVQLNGKDLDILIYPMDVLISGKPDMVTRARAAIASRLTTSAAHLTVTAEAQAVEDRLTALATTPADTDARPRFDEAAQAELAAIDEALATIRISYEEWEVLYRQRLQVERDLRAGAMAGEAVLGAAQPTEADADPLRTITRAIRQGATAMIEAATDDETIEALDKLAGPRWRLAARAADVVLAAARAAVNGSENEPVADRGSASRERSAAPAMTAGPRGTEAPSP